MSEPTVCAIMLTRDRPELARRAVECFRSQTYPAKKLIVMDSSSVALDLAGAGAGVSHLHKSDTKLTIGEIRNGAAQFTVDLLAAGAPDVLIHWDDDDWSHPNRIAEQVSLLQSSGGDCVGYREMLFWRQAEREAWLYSNSNPGYCLGTSLCYWRKTWELKQFRNTSVGEDLQFITGIKCFGVAAFGCKGEALHDPRMIARIHGGNTSNGYTPKKMEAESRRPQPYWRRVPEWDADCRAVMEGK